MIVLKQVSKQFQTEDGTVDALKNVSISIPDGDIFGIIGMSGVLLSTILCLVGINAAWGSHILFRHCFTGERQSGYLLRLAYYAGATGLCCAVTGLCCARLAPGGAAGLAVRLALCLTVPNLILPALLLRLPEFGDAMALARRALRKGA